MNLEEKLEMVRTKLKECAWISGDLLIDGNTVVPPGQPTLRVTRVICGAREGEQDEKDKKFIVTSMALSVAELEAMPDERVEDYAKTMWVSAMIAAWECVQDETGNAAHNIALIEKNLSEEVTEE